NVAGLTTHRDRGVVELGATEVGDVSATEVEGAAVQPTVDVGDLVAVAGDGIVDVAVGQDAGVHAGVHRSVYIAAGHDRPVAGVGGPIVGAVDDLRAVSGGGVGDVVTGGHCPVTSGGDVGGVDVQVTAYIAVDVDLHRVVDVGRV